MRIALIARHVAPIAPPFAGGVESLTAGLARWLAGRGHDVVLYARPGSEVDGVEVRPLDVDLELSEAARVDVSMPPAAFLDAHHAYQRMLIELARDDDGFDLVHDHSLHHLPVAMAPTLATPMLTTLHTPPTPWLESALRTRTDRRPVLTAVSAATARLWDPIATVDAVIPNGIDLEAWPAGPGGRDAVWCGRMVPEKAPHLAIDAARAGGLGLRLAGPIVDGAYWEREIAHRLGADVHYVGHLAPPELAALLGRSAVALLTPMWEEPFGLSAAEAMATGTPVAAFAQGGLPGFVLPASGRLAAPGDVAGLARAVRRAAGLPRAGVRAHARRHLGIDAMGRAYETQYARLLAEDDAHLTYDAA